MEHGGDGAEIVGPDEAPNGTLGGHDPESGARTQGSGGAASEPEDCYGPRAAARAMLAVVGEDLAGHPVAERLAPCQDVGLVRRLI